MATLPNNISILRDGLINLIKAQLDARGYYNVHVAKNRYNGWAEVTYDRYNFDPSNVVIAARKDVTEEQLQEIVNEYADKADKQAQEQGEQVGDIEEVTRNVADPEEVRKLELVVDHTLFTVVRRLVEAVQLIDEGKFDEAGRKVLAASRPIGKIRNFSNQAMHDDLIWPISQAQKNLRGPEDPEARKALIAEGEPPIADALFAAGNAQGLTS